VAPGPLLGEEFLAGKEPVHQEVQGAVQPVQEVHLFLGVMPVIPHELADDRVIPLLYMSIVILVVGTGPGEGDPSGMAETDEVAIHELSSIVRMEGEDLPWVPAETRLEGSDHTDLCFRPYRPCLGPPGALVGDGQGPVEVSLCLSPIMSHQVHGQDPGEIQWRVHARLDGNPDS
jgi:hypothetical protein